MDITATSGFASYLRKVYGMVGGGLVISAIVTFILSTSPDLAQVFYHLSANGSHALKFTAAGWIALLLPFALLILAMFSDIERWSVGAINAYYGIFCASFGVSLYAATSQYTGASVGAALLITAGSFTGLSLTGMMIKTPLTGLKSFCMMGLWGLVLVGLAQMLFHFSLNQTLMSLIGVGVFAGLTVTDTQDMRDRYSEGGNSHASIMMGAMGLYLDAMNMFINILELVGVKKGD